MSKKKLIVKKSWNQFQKTGLLLIVNQILHIFGWAIVINYEKYYNDGSNKNIIHSVYPARVRFRGFTGECVSEAYLKLSKYMCKNYKQLLEEAKE